MNKSKTTIPFIITLCLLLSSCSSIMYIASVTAEVAGMTGVIDQNVAHKN